MKLNKEDYIDQYKLRISFVLNKEGMSEDEYINQDEQELYLNEEDILNIISDKTGINKDEICTANLYLHVSNF